MEVRRIGRSSTSGRSEVSAISATPERDKLATNCHGKLHHHHQQHPKNRSMKMFNKVQVVYYLTRNGQLEHPHFIEVSHLATQPLRLKDVIDRLMVLRGKAMPCQYSWSCKRSYKNGYVWNDMTENDVIYASEGSEYVLKGSEIISERDLSEIRLDELQMKRRRPQQKGDHTKTTGLTMNKSISTHQGQNYSQVVTRHPEQNDNHEDDEEEKGSCNSSNAPYPNPTMEMEQEESYSLPSTSSTNSDKQLPPPPQPPSVPPTQSAKTNRIIEEDGNPTVSTSLTRNSTVLLHLIACGGGGIVGPQVKDKDKGKGSNSNRNFNFNMKNSFMPCLKQQLSTRGSSISNNNVIPLRVKGVGAEDERHINNDHNQVVNKEQDDEDMMMVRFMSENPRFGNLQSEEKEYFSGTIVEAMTYHQHTGSSGSASGHPYLHPQTPVFTKSSSYNEQRSSKAGLAVASTTQQHEDDEKEDAKFKGIFRLCIPQKRSHISTSAKLT